jgi:hypothetical protein
MMSSLTLFDRVDATSLSGLMKTPAGQGRRQKGEGRTVEFAPGSGEFSLMPSPLTRKVYPVHDP